MKNAKYVKERGSATRVRERVSYSDDTNVNLGREHARRKTPMWNSAQFACIDDYITYAGAYESAAKEMEQEKYSGVEDTTVMYELGRKEPVYIQSSGALPWSTFCGSGTIPRLCDPFGYARIEFIRPSG